MGNFERMEVWHNAKEIAIKIYQLSNEGDLSKDYSLRDQLRRSAISVSSNLAEGEESIYNNVSIKFFSIASASLAELRTQFEIAWEIGYIGDDKYTPLHNSMIVLSKRIKKLIYYRMNKKL